MFFTYYFTHECDSGEFSNKLEFNSFGVPLTIIHCGGIKNHQGFKSTNNKKFVVKQLASLTIPANEKRSECEMLSVFLFVVFLGKL